MAAQTLVVVLDKETETKQQRKDGISFPSKEEEQTVPNGCIGKVEPIALCGGVWK